MHTIENTSSYLIKKRKNEYFSVNKNKCIFNIKVAGDREPQEQEFLLRRSRGVLKSTVVVNSKSVDISTVESILAGLIKKGMSDKEKAIAIYRFCSPGTLLHWEPADFSNNILKLLNIYGYGTCGTHAFLFYQLCRHAGLRAAHLGIDVPRYHTGHQLAEVYYNNKWHVFDCDAGHYYLNARSEIASADELKKDPDLINQSADHFGLNHIGWPIGCLKYLHKYSDFHRDEKVPVHSLKPIDYIMKQNSLKFVFKPLDEIIDVQRITKLWKMPAPVFNIGKINSNLLKPLNLGKNKVIFKNRNNESFKGKIVFRWTEKYLKSSAKAKADNIKWAKEEKLFSDSAGENRNAFPIVDSNGNINLTGQSLNKNTSEIWHGSYKSADFKKTVIFKKEKIYPAYPKLYVDELNQSHLVFQTNTYNKSSDIYYLNTKNVKKIIRINQEDKYSRSYFPNMAGYKDAIAIIWQGPNVSRGGDANFNKGYSNSWFKIFRNGKWEKAVVRNGYWKNLILPSITSDSKGNFHCLYLYQGVEYENITRAVHNSKDSMINISPYNSYYSFGSDITTDRKDNIYALWSMANYGLRPNIYLRLKMCKSKCLG